MLRGMATRRGASQRIICSHGSPGMQGDAKCGHLIGTPFRLDRGPGSTSTCPVHSLARRLLRERCLGDRGTDDATQNVCWRQCARLLPTWQPTGMQGGVARSRLRMRRRNRSPWRDCTHDLGYVQEINIAHLVGPGRESCGRRPIYIYKRWRGSWPRGLNGRAASLAQGVGPFALRAAPNIGVT